MKSVLDKATRDELISRINSLNDNSMAQWGKMNVYQMLKHCILCDEMFLGDKKYKQVFLGRLFGKKALNGFLKDETPLKKNEPTSSEFKIAEANGDVTAEKKKWIAHVESYTHYSNNEFVHWFFGKMTKEQIGQFAYKHIDHHLRQFNS